MIRINAGKKIRPINYEEALLAEKFKNGNQDSFDQLWKIYFKVLVNFANQMIDNNQLSEDIVSESFIKLWRLHENFDNIHCIRSFLYVTTRNQCYDHLRSQEIHARIHDEILYSADTFTEDVYGNEMDILYKENIQQLYAELRALPDACRSVFIMYFFERRSTRQIATALNISEQTARNQKTKAIQRLRAVLLKNDCNPEILN